MHAAVLLLHYSCPPVVGGVEEIVRQQAELLHRHYHPVKIIAGMGSTFSAEIPVEINPLLRSNHPEIAKISGEHSFEQPRLEEFTERIYRYLLQAAVGWDFIVAHNVLSMPYNLPLTLALKRLAEDAGKNIIAWNHDSPYFYKNYPDYLNSTPWTVLKTPSRPIKYVTISESRSREFQELYGLAEPLEWIPNGIDPFRFFRLDTATVRLIMEERLFEAELLLVQPSRLHPRKNIELSIRVLAALRQRGVDARLLLTGAHDPHEKNATRYLKKLLTLAADLQVGRGLLIMANYRFQSGEQLSADRVTMRDLYQISDILFLPSKIEGFGIPLLEAGMIKLPVMCSDIPPFRSIGGENVVYFSLQESPEQIAGRMLKILQEQKVHRHFRNVIRHYVWDQIYEERLKALLSLPK
ncbi:MAG: hypothetical protein Kow0037_16620 [Calditrichia bacterium]